MTPIQLDSSRHSTAPALLDTRVGVYSHSGNLYQFALDTDNGSPRHSYLYKSTDNGLTWAIVDSTNAPATNDNHSTSAWYPGSGTIIYFVYSKPNGSNTITLNSFDMATDTFGGDSAAGPAASSGQALHLAVFGNGLQVVFGDAQYYTYSGGTWSSALTYNAEENPAFSAFLLDPDDILHILYRTKPIATFPRVNQYHNTINNTATLGTAQEIYHQLAGFSAMASPALLGTKMVVPVFLSATSGSQNMSVFTASDHSATPTWASHLVDSQLYASYADVVIDGSTIALFYSVLNTDNPSAPVFRVMSSTSTDGATWTAPSLFYDAIVDPPPAGLPADTGDYFTHTVSAAVISAGVYSVIMTISNGVSLYQDSFYLLGSGSPPPPPAAVQNYIWSS